MHNFGRHKMSDQQKFCLL